MTWPPVFHQDVQDQIDLKLAITDASGTYVAAFPVAAPTGTAATDTAAIQARLAAALAAGGGRVVLAAGSYAVNADLVVGDYVSFEGGGSGVTTVALTGTARIVTTNFDTLTGTAPTAAPWGVQNFAIKRMRVTGGAGVKIYGFAYEADDLIVSGANGAGFYSEWTNVNATIPTPGSMEAVLTNVRTHDNGSHGFHYNGPHDSLLTDIISYNNATGSTGIRLDTKANGVQGTHLHSWGVTHAKAVQMLASGIQIDNSQAEGATQAQVEVAASSCAFEGYVYAAGANHAVKGVLTSTGCGGFRFVGIIENCESGAIDFSHDVGGSSYHAIINQTTGSAYVGTIPTNSNALLIPMGGVTIHGYSVPYIMGEVHYADGDVVYQGANIRVNSNAYFAGAVGFFGAISGQRGATADATDLASAITAVNAVLADLRGYGLKAT